MMGRSQTGRTAFSIIKMIIYLEMSPEELSGLENPYLSNCFAEIIRASRNGYHKVIVPRAVAKWAVENLDLTLQDKAHLDRLRAEFSQSGSQIKDSKYVLVLKPRNEPYFDQSEGRYYIDIFSAAHSGMIAPPLLLVENAATDGAVYSYLFEFARKNAGFECIKFEVAHGGGADIVSEFERIVRSGRITVCICDSDKLAPTAVLCSKVRRAASFLETQKFVASIFETVGHELENFFPIDILARAAPSYPSSNITYLRNIIDRQIGVVSGECAWLFFDIKNGIDGERIRKISTNLETFKWIIIKYGIDEEEIDKFRIDGFGPNIASVVLGDNICMKDLFQFSRSEYWANHFSGWFSEILWYFYARQPTRTG